MPSAPRRARTAARISSALADLASHRAVLYGRPGRVRSWLFPRPDGAPEEITPPSRMRFDDLGTIRDAAIGSHGLAWLPCWLIRDEAAAGRLATVLDHLPSYVFATHALWPQAPYLPLRVRLATDALASALPETTSMPSKPSSETSASALT